MLKLRFHKENLLVSVKKQEYSVKVFKILNFVLVMVVNPEFSASFYKFIKDPQDFVTCFYKFSHVSLLISAIKIEKKPYIKTISGKKHNFIESLYDSQEENLTPKFQYRETEQLLIICLSYSNKNVLIKVLDLSVEIIYIQNFLFNTILLSLGKYDLDLLISSIKCKNNSIMISDFQFVESLAKHSINDVCLYRTCVKTHQLLYQVSVAVEGDNLRFVYKKGSFMGLGVEF